MGTGVVDGGGGGGVETLLGVMAGAGPGGNALDCA
jgi:hypothetical protein